MKLLLILKSRIHIAILFLVIPNYVGHAQNDVIENPDSYVSKLITLSLKDNQQDTVSLRYLQEALRLEQKLKDTTLLKLYHTIGNNYQNLQSHYLSLTFFYKELDLQQKLNPDKIFYVENNIGGCYYFLGDKKKARIFWEKSLEGFEAFIKKYPYDIKDIGATLIYNNLAVLEMDQGNNVRALEMLTRFKEQNILAGDTSKTIMAYENLSNAYYKLNDNQSALESLYNGMELAKKINSDYDIASLSSELGKVYFHGFKNKDSAKYYLQKSYNLSDEKQFLDIKLSSSEKLASYFEENKQFDKALQYSKIAKELAVHTLKLDNTKKITLLEFEYEQKLKQERSLVKQKKRENILILGITVLLLFSVIIFLMFKLQKSKAQKRSVENKLLARSLEKKNKELTGNAIQIIQSNEMLKFTQKELRNIRNDSQLPVLSNLINTLNSGTQAFNKAEFEKIFMETEGDFYRRLLQEYPNLTKNEIRLCAFLKLNLSTKEIAAITQKSAHSIVVARSRLRKKLNIEKHEELAVFLNQI